MTVANGMLAARSKSLLHGILYIVHLIKRGLQFPDEKTESKQKQGLVTRS